LETQDSPENWREIGSQVKLLTKGSDIVSVACQFLFQIIGSARENGLDNTGVNSVEREAVSLGISHAIFAIPSCSLQDYVLGFLHNNRATQRTDRSNVNPLSSANRLLLLVSNQNCHRKRVEMTDPRWGSTVIVLLKIAQPINRISRRFSDSNHNRREN
jgi:hypothetical protein